MCGSHEILIESNICVCLVEFPVAHVVHGLTDDLAVLGHVNVRVADDSAGSGCTSEDASVIEEQHVCVHRESLLFRFVDGHTSKLYSAGRVLSEIVGLVKILNVMNIVAVKECLDGGSGLCMINFLEVFGVIVTDS